MAWHSDREVHIELKVFVHLLVHLKRIVWSTVEVFPQVILRVFGQ